MRSSYIKNNYGEVIYGLVNLYRPKNIVEFGILDGYSLQAITRATYWYKSRVRAFDLFEDYKYKNARFKKIQRQFAHTNAEIEKIDFYGGEKMFDNGEIDLLHIDISNDGDVYEYAIENYLPKLSPSGLMVLEGGSEERDKVGWMVKYNKKPIRPVLLYTPGDWTYLTLQPFPSLTIIQRENCE